MVKNNYSAWHVNSESFSEDWPNIQKLKFFARYAVLAPSGHNTQPWHFSFHDQTLLLKNNPDRHLPYSGTQAAEPYISLGTCLGTLNLAAKGFGYQLAIDYDAGSEVIAHITIDGQTVADPSLLTAIVHRTSNRNPFDHQSLPAKLLESFTKTDLKNVSAYSVSDRKDISFIADQTKHATHLIMGDPKFRLELSKWVRNNVTRQHDGMPGFTQGMPTPPSMIARHIIKNVDISKGQAKKDASRITDSANLVLVMIKDQSSVAFLDAGRLYAQICILAQQQGVATSGVGAAVIDPTTKQAIKEHFELSYQPVAIIRLGRTKKHARHTPRWSLSAVSDQF